MQDVFTLHTSATFFYSGKTTPTLTFPIKTVSYTHLDVYKRQDVQFIWQTGKYYYPQVTEAVKAAGENPNLYVTDFIKDMAAAYAAADLDVYKRQPLLRKELLLFFAKICRRNQ